MPERKPNAAHQYDGVNDALFMSSRDGVHWNRWLDAWVRPGPDGLNWTERNNYPVWGIAETSPAEWSMYVTEHYRHAPLPTRMRRLLIRPWGFVSVRGDYGGGEMVTKPFTFTGASLRLNAATSTAPLKAPCRLSWGIGMDRATRLARGGRRSEIEIDVPDGLDGTIRFLRLSVGSATRFLSEDIRAPKHVRINADLELRGVPGYLSPTWEQWFEGNDE